MPSSGVETETVLALAKQLLTLVHDGVIAAKVWKNKSETELVDCSGVKKNFVLYLERCDPPLTLSCDILFHHPYFPPVLPSCFNRRIILSCIAHGWVLPWGLSLSCCHHRACSRPVLSVPPPGPHPCPRDYGPLGGGQSQNGLNQGPGELSNVREIESWNGAA